MAKTPANLPRKSVPVHLAEARQSIPGPAPACFHLGNSHRGDGPYLAVDAAPKGLPKRGIHGLETETVRRCDRTTLLPTA
jgi:hypothetical protein